MAANSLEVANNALIHIGAATIASLGDASKEARLCNARYDPCRKTVLRSFPWNFALKRVVLNTPTGNQPAFEYSKEYALPNDFLRLVKIDTGGGYYRLENNLLLCDSDEVDLTYIADVTTTTKFDAMFDDALALYLAWNISSSLVQSEELRNLIWKQYLAVLKLARFASSTENRPGALESNILLEARIAPSTGLVRDPMT